MTNSTNQPKTQDLEGAALKRPAAHQKAGMKCSDCSNSRQVEDEVGECQILRQFRSLDLERECEQFNELDDRASEIRNSHVVQAYCKQLKEQGIKYEVVLLQPKPLLAALPNIQPDGG